MASRIIGAIKDNLHTFIVATLWDMLDTTDDSTESIIQNALSLWLSCCLSNPEALASFLASESADAQAFIVRGLAFEHSVKVREEFNHTFSALALKADAGSNQAFTFIL